MSWATVDPKALDRFKREPATPFERGLAAGSRMLLEEHCREKKLKSGTLRYDNHEQKCRKST